MAKQSESIASQVAQKTEPSKMGQLTTMYGKSAAIEVIPRFSTPYLIFAQPKAQDQWKELLKTFSDIEDGDPVLIYPEPQPKVKLDTVRCTMLAAVQYWAIRDNAGKELERFFKKDDCLKTGQKRVEITGKQDAGKAHEYIWASLILYFPDKALPVTCKFKTTKCAAAQSMSDELKKCTEPDWAKNGAAFEMAVAASNAAGWEPWTRIVATIGIGGRTGQTSGIAYKPTRANIAPSSAAEWKLLKELESHRFHELKSVAEAFNEYLATLQIK